MTAREANAADPIRARELVQRADDRLARGDRAEAATALEQAAAADPWNDDAPLLAAMLRFQDGDLAGAAGLALQAIRIRPFHPSAMNLLAMACLDAGHAVEARKILQRVVATAPGFAQAKRNLRIARSAPRSGGSGAATDARLPIEAIRGLCATYRPELSACIVVTGDDAGVGGSVASVRGSAAEILVLDATRGGRIAETLEDDKVTVCRIPWTADGAAIRNTAIARASRDWVLTLDCGETLLAECETSLRQLLARRRNLYHELVVRGGGGARLECRLFRNAPGVRFVGSIYPSIRPALRALACKWKLTATNPGILVDSERTALYGRDRSRDRELLEAMSRQELRQHPDNPYLVLQRARVELETGEPAKALRGLSRLDHVEPDAEHWVEPEELATLTARCLCRLERFSDAADRIAAYHRSGPPTRNTLYLEGQAARALGEPGTAVRLLDRCLDGGQAAGCLAPLPELAGAGPANLLGAAHLDLGRLDAAYAAFHRALEIEPENFEARLGLLGVRVAREEIEPLLEDLDRWVADQGDDPRVWSYGAFVLGRLPSLAEVAEQWTDEACRRFPKHVDLRRLQVEARLRLGRADAALESLTELPRDTPAELAAEFAASLAAGVEPPSIPDPKRDAVTSEVLGWLRLWMACAAYPTLDRVLLAMPGAAERLPGLPALAAEWLDEVGQAEAATRIRQEVGASAGA